MVDSSFDKDTVVVVVLFELTSGFFGEVFSFLLSVFGKGSACLISYEARI